MFITFHFWYDERIGVSPIDGKLIQSFCHFLTRTGVHCTMCTMYILLATLSPNALVAFQNDNGNEGKTPLHYLDHKYDALLIMMRMLVMVRMVLLFQQYHLSDLLFWNYRDDIKCVWHFWFSFDELPFDIQLTAAAIKPNW